MKRCAWCQTTFAPTVSYQIYCSEFCRVDATKHNQANKKKVRRNKKVRTCANSDCTNKLSAYNNSKYCSNCFFSEHLIVKEINKVKRNAQNNKD